MSALEALRSRFTSTSILLVDGVGAAMTAIGVGLVLPALQPWFGLPAWPLRALGVVGLCFALFSLGRHFSGTASPASLRQIAIANLTYCAAGAGLLVSSRNTATLLAYLYIGFEIVVVVALSLWELRLARRLTKSGSAAAP